MNHTTLSLVCLLSPALMTACSPAQEPLADEGTEISSSVSDLGGKPAKIDLRKELLLPGPRFFPEGIAASSDGSFYVGSIGTGAVVRFAPGATQPETLVPARDAFGVYGLAVDEARGLLWACTYDDLLYPAQPAYLSAYDLATGAEEASFVMPGESGFCNDLILDDEGNVYATDSLANTIVRLPSGGSALETWAADPAFVSDPGSFTVNGIVYDHGHDQLYVVKYATGELFSVPVNADGSAGPAHAIPVSPKLEFPDGIEMLHDGVFLVVENNVGRVSIVTLWNGAGTKIPVAHGLKEPTTAAIYNHSAWVVEGQVSLLYSEDLPSLPFRVRRVPSF